jgi:cytochrome c peroxidase
MKIYPFVASLLAVCSVTFSSGNLRGEPQRSVLPVVEPLTHKAFKPRVGEPVKPLKVPVVLNPAMVELGKKLFFDPRLSKTGFISCNSCHNLSMGGSDNLKTSIGHNLREGALNAPTVLNASMSFAQFWNGRAKDLKQVLSIGDYAYGGTVAFVEGQVDGKVSKPRKPSVAPVGNPGGDSFTHDLAVPILQSIPLYAEEFKKVFRAGKINIDQVITAISTFEETLLTPNSRFDQWLRGDDRAITKQELAGYRLFKSSGCTICHNGASLGANSFQKTGIVKAYKTTCSVSGCFEITKKDVDRFRFKVPTLRNVELTYPYFHDGEVATLSKSVEIMGQIQLGKTYTEQETASIVAFLKSLTGDQPQFMLPQLPPSSETTPSPQPLSPSL